MLTELLDLEINNAKSLENLNEDQKKNFLLKKFDDLKIPDGLKNG